MSYWAKSYWADPYWIGEYWPPSSATAPYTPTGGTVQYLDVGGDGLTMIGIGFVTLTLSFPNGVAMRTE